MIDNEILVNELGLKLKYLPNKKDTSYYKTYKMPNDNKDRQIRISSHGTYLKYWIEQDYNPSHGININIAFTKDGKPTNDCHIDMSTNEPYKDCKPCLTNQKKKPFSVTQYVYNCQNFDGNEINICVEAIKKATQTGKYVDPFKGIEGKEALCVILLH